MEDSGWYKANYEVAETLHWGHHLGCDFAMKSCGEWIKSRLESNFFSFSEVKIKQNSFTMPPIRFPDL
uniref:Leishmanolysin-like peptidase n=1 Tax=Ditylenchus dipsaci TaxID=166011 RepID=A0A915CT66_9BILA